MHISEYVVIGLQALPGTAKDGTAVQHVVVVEPSEGPDAGGFVRDPEVFRIEVPATRPPLTFPVGARLLFRGLDVSEWRARDGRHGIRRAAESVEVVGAADPAGASAPPSAPVASRRSE